MSEPKEPPIAVSLAQWPEGRSFSRLYWRDPVYQARLAMALYGLRSYLEMDGQPEQAETVGRTLRVFHEHFPHFMQDGLKLEEGQGLGEETYHMDPRLRYLMAEVLVEEQLPDSTPQPEIHD